MRPQCRRVGTETKTPRQRGRRLASFSGPTDLPVGTVTFLMTDIEGSTRLWDASPRIARQALDRHDRLVVEQVEKNQGQMVEAGREGDSALAVFRQATDAVSCALDIQRALQSELWPVGIQMAVRIAVHTGEAELKSCHYIGGPLYRCARLMAAAHGGEVLLSRATHEMVVDNLRSEVSLRDLGQHRLRDLSRNEHIFQLLHPDLKPDFPPLKSLEPERTNLPQLLTSFVGRQAELAALRKALKESRLVTLTGPGGSGKTRLALELGRDLLGGWPGGVWWVDLTAISDPKALEGGIASALRLHTLGEARERLQAWLSEKKRLLLLDNCEHLVEACADFCRVALARSPELAIVATSREALAVDGEARWPVASLTPEDATELFEKRAKLVAPTYSVSNSNRADVTEICRRLDLLPLGVELAASKVSIMTEKEIARQLDERLDVLSMSRSADARHRTMTAAIDWSYRLLDRAEAALFRRLSIFRGGFDLESAEAVCRDQLVPNVLPTLALLVDKSMVVSQRLADGASRYRLLESQLAYAAQKLTPDESRRFHERHFDYFWRMLVSKTGGPSGPMAFVTPGAADNRWKRREFANLWVAARWARDNREDIGLPLVGHMALIETADAPYVLRWLTDLLSRDYQGPRVGPAGGSPLLLANSAAARLSFRCGDYAGAVRFASDAANLVVPDSTPRWKESRATALHQLGIAYGGLGRFAEARAAFEEGAVLARNLSNRRPANNLQHALGVLSLEEGDSETARSILSSCLAPTAAYDPPGALPGLIQSLANAELACGLLESAEGRWKESLRMSLDLEIPGNAIACLGGLARIASIKLEHAGRFGLLRPTAI